MKNLSTAIQEAFNPVNEESFWETSKFASEEKLKLSNYKGISGLDRLFDEVDYGTEKQMNKLFELVKKAGVDTKKLFKYSDEPRVWFSKGAKEANMTDAQADKLIALILNNTKPESYFNYESVT